MISTGVLVSLIVVELLVAATAGLVVFGHGWALGYRARRDGPMLRRARDALAGRLAGDDVDVVAEDLPRRVWRRAVAEVAPSIEGLGKERLQDVAKRVGLVEEATAWCRSRRWPRRLGGAHLLTLYGLEIPRSLLVDGSEVVRAKAAEWAGDHPDEYLAEQVLDLLDDPSPRCRHAAIEALMRFGSTLTGPLRRRLESSPSGRLLELARWRPDPGYLDAALAAARPGEPWRASAGRLLGELGSGEAVDPLHRLLGDVSGEVRAAAAAALGRMGHWPSATAVAPLLGDPSWEVRLAAGDALASMGAPGMLLLRRLSEGHGDPFAADMARKVREMAALKLAGAKE